MITSQAEPNGKRGAKTALFKKEEKVMTKK
jgi:hypothetical protein